MADYEDQQSWDREMLKASVKMAIALGRTLVLPLFPCYPYESLDLTPWVIHRRTDERCGVVYITCMDAFTDQLRDLFGLEYR